MSVPTPYKLRTPDTNCPHCKKPVHLLTSVEKQPGKYGHTYGRPDLDNPEFWICWRCKRIWHVLNGEVKEDV